MMKIGFLFNHDAAHQAAHLLPVLTAYAAIRPDDILYAYVSDAEMRATVQSDLPHDIADRVQFVELALPGIIGGIARFLDATIPASRVARLRLYTNKFRHLNALVAPERTCLFLKQRFGLEGVKFIHVRHGAGDRAISFHPSFRNFDLLLLQGNKYLRKLRQSGGLDGNTYALIGYPKFDSIDINQPRKNLFGNDNPTVFYNPHFAPGLSSWNAMGLGVLDYFAANPDLNLIFAPHVMLFKKWMHIRPKGWRVSIRRRVPKKYNQYKNILIDVDSPRLFDMTYTLNSDLYLADVSSQVVEFLVRPRPCVFLNPHHLNWRDKEEFASWRLGEVVENIADLGPALRRSLANPSKYEAAQKAHLDDTFDMSDQPSSMRAAQAIADFLEGRSTEEDRRREAPRHLRVVA
jgi:CDP-glycerol glycerophosphotransferase (TagB/SpsB family)